MGKIFSREDMFARIYFRVKIFSREQYNRENIFSRKYLKFSFREISFRENNVLYSTFSSNSSDMLTFYFWLSGFLMIYHYLYVLWETWTS